MSLDILKFCGFFLIVCRIFNFNLLLSFLISISFVKHMGLCNGFTRWGSVIKRTCAITKTNVQLYIFYFTEKYISCFNHSILSLICDFSIVLFIIKVVFIDLLDNLFFTQKRKNFFFVLKKRYSLIFLCF